MPTEMCNIPALIDINKVRGTGRTATAAAPDAPLHLREPASAFISIKGRIGPGNPDFSLH